MLQTVLDKRTYDERLIDVDFSDLLDPDETLVSCSAPVDADSAGLAFGTPVINQGPVAYPQLGRSAGPGKVVQAMVSGGELLAGEPSRTCTVRFRAQTSLGQKLEATVAIRLIDSPP